MLRNTLNNYLGEKEGWPQNNQASEEIPGQETPNYWVSSVTSLNEPNEVIVM